MQRDKLAWAILRYVCLLWLKTNGKKWPPGYRTKRTLGMFSRFRLICTIIRGLSNGIHVCTVRLWAPEYPAGFVWRVALFEPAVVILKRFLSEELVLYDLSLHCSPIQFLNATKVCGDSLLPSIWQTLNSHWNAPGRKPGFSAWLAKAFRWS